MISNFLPDNCLQEQTVEDLLHVPDDSESEIILECDLGYPAEVKQKTENFPLRPYQEDANLIFFKDYINSGKQPNNKPTTDLVCDSTNQKNYMMQYKMIKVYLDQGLNGTNIHTSFWFKQAHGYQNTLITIHKNAPKEKQTLKTPIQVEKGFLWEDTGKCKRYN